MRHELKQLSLDARKALLASRKVPLKLKTDKSGSIPFYYDCDSWNATVEVPWHEAEKRAMTPAEGITLLATELDEREVELGVLRKKMQAAKELLGV